jgi:hypothetical protein
VSRRGRLGLAVACLLVLGLLAGWVTWSASSIGSASGPAGRTPATVTLAPSATEPAGLTVTSLDRLEQLRARFNAGQGAPRLVLALAPT